MVLFLGLVGCSQRPPAAKTSGVLKSVSTSDRNVKVEEVSPPATIQKLRLALDRYQPKVKILGPKSNALLEDTTVTVRFDVDDFPLFKDPDLALGPHLHVFLDDQPYQAVYDANQSLTFKDLSPGTHTIRAFASRPWHESVKTVGAFDQLTFHVFAPTQANQPDPEQPLLTYSRPEGVYGAEPIMLDYYLTLPANTSSAKPCQVRVSLNGTSFTTDEWTPIYLKGFKPGANWVKLELLDKSGKLANNAYSETLRLIQFNPNGQDTLSRLVRGELTAQDAERVVDLKTSQRMVAQKRDAKRVSEPVLVPKGLELQPLPSPVVPAIPVVPVSPSPSPSSGPAAIAPESPKPLGQSKATPSPSPKPTMAAQSPKPAPSSKPLVRSSPMATPSPEIVQEPVPLKLKSGGLPESGRKAEGEQPFWAKFNPKQLLSGKSSQGMDGPQKVPAAPSAEPIAPPLPIVSPTASVMPTKVATPKIVKPLPAKPSEVEVKPTVTPAPTPTAAAQGVEREKKTVRWQDFLKVQSGNTENRPIVAPTEAPSLPSRYLKKNEPDSLSEFKSGALPDDVMGITH